MNMNISAESRSGLGKEAAKQQRVVAAALASGVVDASGNGEVIPKQDSKGDRKRWKWESRPTSGSKEG